MKLSNLFESPDMIDTPAFKAWFGNSKIVDKNGKPLRVYHGSFTSFASFRGAAYFSADPGYASNTAEITSDAYDGSALVVPVYLSIQNPAIRDVDFIEGIGYDERIQAELEAQGFDGAMTPDKSEIYVFAANQIKSATGNSGNYDPNNDDITESII